MGSPAEIEGARSERRQELPADKTARQLDEIVEAELPYNCEHVVPQSWFDAREPMRGDLHHLFACESRCNSFRGNLPYFDFADAQDVARDACGRQGPEGFEPASGT